MHIGVTLAFDPRTPPALVLEAARMAEERGFHSLWVPEHVLFFRDYDSRYPYADDGRIPGDPEGVLDPFSALTFVAAHTARIRLGTGICIVPQRHPVYTAKQVADLDHLSGGRVDFGIGVGWLEEEFDALGIPFRDRGARTDECLEAMKALWTQDAATHRGERFRFEGALLNPKPVQRPHPPILVGGESRAAFRRVAHHGQGWYGFDLTPERLAEGLAGLDAALSEAGRRRSDVQVHASPAGRGRIERDTLAAFRDAGVDQAIVPTFGRDADGFRKRMDTLAEVAQHLGRA
jgi:probable F420-dependent oxidoreductase